MGCNFCDDCSDCSVGGGLGCALWDHAEHEEPRDFYDYESEYDEIFEEEEERLLETIHCVQCGTLAELGWNYCLKCGSAIPKKFCVNCGKEVIDDWKYCPVCGKDIPCVNSDDNPIINNIPLLANSENSESSVYDEDIPF